MKLKKSEDLDFSSVVANCNMNRKRQLLGVNSYQNDVGLDIIDFLEKRLETETTVNWIDLCCGEGNALIQAQEIFTQKKIINSIKIEGLDLVNMFNTKIDIQPIELFIGSIRNWKPQKNYDLITCVHGLHYVGDKLGALEKILSLLKKNGYFVANLSLENIKDNEGQSLKKSLSKTLKINQIDYNSSKKIISCDGQKTIQFDYNYTGANDKAGPNYTGQPVVDSIYLKAK